MSSDVRVRALEALYADDAVGGDDHVDDLGGRAARMVEGVREHLTEIDAELTRASDRWRLERMPAVDRAVLRLATWELLHSDTPMPVVISEAVELAKQYSTERSGAFVNAVLAKVADAAGSHA
jgi:N utilization substance protein B